WEFFSTDEFLGGENDLGVLILGFIVTFILLSIYAVILEMIWLLLFPIRKLGLTWVLRMIYEKGFPVGIRRWFDRRKPNKRGISLGLTSVGAILIAITQGLLGLTALVP
ncbi:MAG: hypothetical protein ACK5M4_10505, partial [Pseudorhodobacter sp.]